MGLSAGTQPSNALAERATTIPLAVYSKSWMAIRRQTGVRAAQARDAGGLRRKCGGRRGSGGAAPWITKGGTHASLWRKKVGT